MKIEFFGHSIAGKNKSEKFDTFVDRIINKYSTSGPDNIGIAKCSEERILYNLKKTKDIDIAIIFHSDPVFYFCPMFKSDNSKLSEKDFESGRMVFKTTVYTEYRNDKRIDNNILETNRDTLSIEETKNVFKLYQEYFYTPETNKNRHAGALIQIDQYLSFKKIKAIHLLQDKTHIPNWFNFTTGIVDFELAAMQHDNNPYSCSYSRSANAITEEGNDIIFNKLSEYIDKLKS